MVHMTPYRNELVNIKKLPESDVITMGNGSQEEAKEVADVIGTIHHQGKQCRVRIQDVTLLTNGHLNLFSISQMLQKGWRLHGDKESITISKGEMTIVFDITIPTKKGMLYAMRVKRDQEYCCIIGTENTVKMSVNEAHCKLGHMSIQATKAVANTLNWKLTGAPEVL
jgi:hypothetical protein